MSIGSTIGSVIFGAIFLIAGYFIAFSFGAPVLENAKASESWPKTTATIVESKVEKSRSDGKTMYSAQVEYKYEVDGQEYTNDTIWFGGNYSTSSRSGPQKTVAKYPVKKTVDAFYNPEEPSTAVLEPGAFFSSYLLYGVGWIFMIIGGLVLLSGLGMIAFGLLAVGVAVQKPPQNNSNQNWDQESSSPPPPDDDDFIENL